MIKINSKKFGSIFVYNNSHIEKIIINKKNHTFIKMLTLKTLIKEIYYFQPKPFEYFLNKGLDKKSNSETTIALIKKNDLGKKKLFYYCFNNSKSKYKNDIPFYHPKVPDGYSIFCSQCEYDKLMAYLKKYKIKKEKNSEENSPLVSIPIFNICCICGKQFNDYKEHVNRKNHFTNLMKHKTTINQINLTFQRIVNYNKKKNNNNIKLDKNKNINVINEKENEVSKDNNAPYNIIININSTNKKESFLNNNKNNDKNKSKPKEKYIDLPQEKMEDRNANDIMIISGQNDLKQKKEESFLRKRKRD